MHLLQRFKGSLVKEPVVMGLDIGSSFIKFAKVKFLKDGVVKLLSVGKEPVELSSLADTLKRIAQTEAIDTVNISVCGPSTLIRYADFPQMNNADLHGALRFEAQKHIPLPVGEITLDAHVLKRDLPDNKMLVLLAAVKNSFLHERLKLFLDAGIRVNIVDIDSLALANAFIFNYSPEESAQGRVVALLNIGAFSSNLNILEEGVLHLSRDLYIAGNNFTKRIADTLGINSKEAEELKCHSSPEKAERVREAVNTVLGYLSTEIRVSFDYYESQCSCSVAKIFLSGGSASFSALKDMLSEMLGVEVQPWDPLRKLEVDESILVRAGELSASLAVAVGLALRKPL